MKTYILWNGKYKGMVGGAFWDQFLVNARNGHGIVHYIDADNVNEAKALMDKAKPIGPNAFALTTRKIG